jgi:DNA ligase-1
MTFKPMRAAGPDPKKGLDHFWKNLKYPLLCSPKIDGIRGCSHHGIVTSRSGELLPSYQVQEELSPIEWVDCEIIEGNPTDFGVYNRTQSHVMSADKPGELSYHVFDFIHPDWLEKPFYQRLEEAEKVVQGQAALHLRFVEHTEVENLEELLAYEDRMLAEGWEGIMGRDPVAPYKQGQSTYNQGWMYKFKRFSDTEGVIVGFVEEMTNTNEQERSPLGFAKRSKSKEGLVPADTLGKFLVEFQGSVINVGCGVFTHSQRKEIWDEQGRFKGRLLKFRFFAHGIKDQPRHARALGFRDPMDL